MAIAAVVGCGATSPQRREPTACSDLDKQLAHGGRIETLDRLSLAFSTGCFSAVIHHGQRAQEQFGVKRHNPVKEAASVFVPDGTLTDYVLESYERAWLSVMMAASYAALGNLEDARVELRRMDKELFAPGYNFGQDPVNILLSAVLWERYGEGGEAAVDWRRLAAASGGLAGLAGPARSFAAAQLERIDRKGPARWHVVGVGRFPAVEWALTFTKSTSGYFRIWPKQKFPAGCVSETGIRLSTRPWFEKILVRHRHAYHPLLHAQAWIRLPIGVVYSLVTVGAGAGIAVGGCTLDLAGDGHGALCDVSIRGGAAVIATAPKVLKGTLKPDLRHWRELPAAFVVTRAPAQEPCLADLRPADARRTVTLAQ